MAKMKAKWLYLNSDNLQALSGGNLDLQANVKIDSIVGKTDSSVTIQSIIFQGGKVDGVDIAELQTLTGVSTGSVNLGTFTGTTIADNSTIKGSLQALETSLEEIDVNVNDLITLTGIAENVQNLGSFTGSTIADDSTIKSALQSLETKVEAVDSSVVHKAGDETITGNKDFQAGIKVDTIAESTSSAGITLSNTTLIDSSLTVTGNTTINGDLTVNGSTITTNTETVLIEDNTLLINKNQTGNGVSAGFAGIEVERGDLDNYRFVFDETRDAFVLGMDATLANLQVAATREDAPTANGIAIWNDTAKRFDTSTAVTYSSSVLSLGDIDINTSTNVITGLANLDSSSTDSTATNKKYVDDAISGISGGAITDLQNEVDAIETSVGLNTDGTKPDFTSLNYILAGDSHASAINKLDAALSGAVSDLSGDISDVAGDLSTHSSDETVHLTSAQNTWIDAITASADEINLLDGITAINTDSGLTGGATTLPTTISVKTYIDKAVSDANAPVIEFFTATAAQTDFVLAAEPQAANLVDFSVSMAPSFVYNVDFTVNTETKTVTYTGTVALEAGEKVRILYYV